MMNKYQPSNGTEGMWFCGQYCDNCMHDNPEQEKDCEILGNTMIYSINEPEYPSEWQYKDGKPTCTAFVKWDWGNDGDPNDPDNPKAPTPPTPDNIRQLSLFPLYPNESDFKKEGKTKIEFKNGSVIIIDQ